LTRLRPGEIPGIRGERTGKPWATILLVALSFGTFLSLAFVVDGDLALTALSGDPWRFVTAPFLNANGWAQFASVIGLGIFGWLLERRHGHWAPLLVAIVGGAAGIGVVLLADPHAFATGANGPALAMLAAWVVPDLQRLRRDEEVDSDLLGVAAIAVILVLLPAAVEDAHPLAGAGGGVAGLILGFLLSARAR
jgi:membrane associated rhomboid family serine protease